MGWHGDDDCPSCGQKGWTKRKCGGCGTITCGKCSPQSHCPCGGRKTTARAFSDLSPVSSQRDIHAPNTSISASDLLEWK